MALASNIVRRGSTYYVRVAVPQDLQPRVGKSETWVSLRTKSVRDARRLGAARLAELHAGWEDMRRQIKLTPAELQRAAATFYQQVLEQDRLRRAALPPPSMIEAEHAKLVSDLTDKPAGAGELAVLDRALDFLVMRDGGPFNEQSRQTLLKELRKHLRTNETRLVHFAADEAIQREGFAVEKGSAQYHELCHVLQRAWVDGLERTMERDEGKWTGQPTDPIVTAPTGDKPATAAPGENILELFDVYASENPRNVKPDTLKMNRQIVGWLSQSVGPSFPASKIDKKVVREWKNGLKKFPVKAAEISEFRGKTFKSIILRNETLKRPTLSARTQNKYLSALGAYCQWLMQNGHLDDNPVTGMHVAYDKSRTNIRPYTADEMNAIFASPLFVGCASDEQPHLPGPTMIRDHRYWLPLLSLFSGARLGELAQLLVDDVREVHGNWIMHVTVEGDASKTTKTKGSMRVVPIHAELIKLGFIEYHGALKNGGERRLFPGMQHDTRGQIGGQFSRFYGRYVTKIGVKNDKTINFHSYRHGMADALRRGGYMDEDFGVLLGHSKATTTGRYGNLPEGTLSERVKMIEAVSFPGLKIAHLYS
jgi:integrase